MKGNVTEAIIASITAIDAVVTVLPGDGAKTLSPVMHAHAERAASDRNGDAE